MVCAVAGVVAGVCALASPAMGETICEIDRIRESGVYDAPFELLRDAKVRVRAVGAGPVEEEPLLSYAWILDARTRKPVWEMTRENTQALRRGSEDRVFEGEIDLPAGRYIAYFNALQRYYVSPRGLKFFRKWIGVRTSGGFLIQWDAFGEPRRWELTLETTGSGDVVRDWSGEIETDDFLHFAPLGDNAAETAAFHVSRATDVTLHCLAEYDSGSERYVDRAWIADALTRRVVWETNDDDAEPAGGALKNHAFDVRLRLDPGDYVLSYITDDSHSYEEFNESAPYDPQAWGVSLSARDEDALRLIEDPREQLLVAAVDRVGSGTFERRAFSIDRPMTVRIEGTGELDDDDLLDYGWLERAPEGTVVWTMENDRGEHAGGHHINRFVASTIDLDPGMYMLSYITDAAHAYGDWSYAPPNDPAAWGVRVYATDKNFDRSSVKAVDPRDADPAVIALAPTGDGTHRKQLMTLPRAYDLRVICMGEGLDHHMYDYGWIENAETNEVVWEMHYDDARHAGGAGKNRVVDEVIRLEPGRYRVHYVTDGSHSFGDWNASRPDRPQLWGITIYPAGSGPKLDRWD